MILYIYTVIHVDLLLHDAEDTLIVGNTLYLGHAKNTHSLHKITCVLTNGG